MEGKEKAIDINFVQCHPIFRTIQTLSLYCANKIIFIFVILIYS